MSKSILLPAGADLIAAVCSLIEDSGTDPQKTLVVFPSRRPKAILARELSRRKGKAMMAPRCFSIGDFIDRCARELGYDRPRLDPADGAALIHQLHPGRQLPGSPVSLPLETFLSWGFTLFSDFEELKSEGILPEALESVQALAEEPLPASFGSQLEHLGHWYREFYRELEARGLATEASTAWLVAERAGQIDLSGYGLIIAAGFYAVTRSEQKILDSLLVRPGAVLVLRAGPGIEHTIKQLELKPERSGDPRKPPMISYLSSGDSHGQVMALDPIINSGPGLSETVLVLARQETVFPVIHHLLPKLDGDWNISMGYPLSRTPLYSLVEALAQAHEGRENGSYFLPQYLKLMLHPYIKNLSLEGASYSTRILLHAVEETLIRKSRRLVRPEDIISDPELRKETDKRLAGLAEKGMSLDQLYGHLDRIHRLVLEPFEQVTSVADFARKVSEVVSTAASHSTAGRHPFAEQFFYRMIEALSRLESSLLAGQKFDHIRNYFGLLHHYASGMTVPFPGTPLRGLQVLGFMETRNLTFGRVVMLDANEGNLPVTSGVDTILPQSLRRGLGLPTAYNRELTSRYHFRNLLAGAGEAVLCYGQGQGAQKSRFLEELAWEEEKEEKFPKEQEQRPVHFRASFSQTDPQPIVKSGLMMEAVSGLRYSATMLDCYLGCGLRFCHQYLMRIKEKEEITPDVEASEVGRLVHRALKDFFGNRRKKVFAYHPSMEREMEDAVDQAFAECFGRAQDGGVHLIKSQVKTRLVQLLGYHSQEPPSFSVQEVELELGPVVDVPGAGQIPVFGVLDRVDNRQGETVIVDYKTGYGETPSFDKFVSQDRERWSRWLRSVQLPFYIMLYLASRPGLEASSVNSELLKLGVAKFERKPLFPPGGDRGQMYRAYREAIDVLIREIRDPKLPFTAAAEPLQECPNCQYKLLCGRQWMKERE
jgi:hypothetical protein